MRRYYQVAGVLVLGVAIYVMVESRTGLDYYTEYGLGPGFLPFWCGVFLAGFTLAWLFHVTFRPVEAMPKGFIPTREGATRILTAIAALLIFALLISYLGFQLPLTAFLFILLLTLGRQSLLMAVVLSVAGGWGLTYVFRNVLDVPLPMSAFEVLSNLGL